MQKIIISLVQSLIIFAFTANMSAQINANAGQIGIGTAADPLYKLTIAGNTHTNGNINFEYDGELATIEDYAAFYFTAGNTLAGFTGALGNPNVSFGYGAKTGRSGNTAIGAYAFYSNQFTSCNTAVGNKALYSNKFGDNNTAIGAYSLYSDVSGNGNTAVGYSADVNAGNLTNATAIGYNAIVNASNKIVLGNTNVTSIVGYTSITITSDGRAKKNIQTNIPGLAFINLLQPVTYNMNLDALDELQKSDDSKINARRDSIRMARSTEEKRIEKQARANKEKQVYSGFIAQDVEKAARSLDYDFSGVDVPENDKNAYGLRYEAFVVPLVKAVQELSGQNNLLRDELTELHEQNNRLTEQNDRQQKQIDELYRLLGKEDIPDMSKISSSNKSVTGLPELTADNGTYLQQNIPNPFSQATQIKYYLPENVNTAYLCIYNLQGKQLKQVRLSQRGEGLEIIQGSQFAPGMYLYALIVDGHEVDVKRMILTK